VVILAQKVANSVERSETNGMLTCGNASVRGQRLEGGILTKTWIFPQEYDSLPDCQIVSCHGQTAYNAEASRSEHQSNPTDRHR